MKKPNQRVVITGMGVLSPNGNSLDAFWQNTLDCVSGIGEISRFDTADFPVKVAGEIKDFDLGRYLPSDFKLKKKRMGLHTQYGVAATQMSLKDAGLTIEDLQKSEPIPLLIGVSTSAIEIIELGKEKLLKSGPEKVSPYTVSASQPHGLVSQIANTLRIKTSQSTFSSACPAGMEAIDAGIARLLTGKNTIAICGGADAPITPLTVASFNQGGMIQQSEFPPEQCSRPFDAKRIGGIIAEGAGVVILETLESALNRGKKPICELIGYGNYSDDYGTPAGSGLESSMNIALENAGKLPEDISFINAHGSSDRFLDKVETQAIKSVFGTHAYNLVVTSIKGVIGNPLAAAGPLQLISTALSIRDNLIPPTANYTFPDFECDLNYVKNSPLPYVVDTALINLHGLGGGNCSLILERYKP